MSVLNSVETSRNVWVEDQVALRTRPSGPPAMFQSWRTLLFLHFPCDPHELSPYLPKELELDTFPGPDGRESAWLGLVPFHMQRVRPRLMPPLPGLSTFPETNIRTYVRRQGKTPGVWFFSLDAHQRLACRLARAWSGLNYYYSKMRVERRDDHVRYESRRPGGHAQHCIEAEFGTFLGPAKPGTLEFFLVERYLLYSVHRGKLITAQIHHEPYLLREIQSFSVSETLVQSLGIRPRQFVHALGSEGVNTQIFAPKPAR